MRDSDTLPPNCERQILHALDTAGQGVGKQAEVRSVRDGAIAFVHPVLGARDIADHDTSRDAMTVCDVGNAFDGILKPGRFELSGYAHLDRQVVVTDPET